jgi:hypothetical protein
VEELDTFARRADGFTMCEGFADPVDCTTVLLERRDVRAAGDEESVEEGGALAFEVVGWFDTCAGGGFVFAFRVDGGAVGTDDEGRGFGGFEGRLYCFGCGCVVAVCYEDSDAAGGDGGFRGGVVGLWEGFGWFAVVWSAFLFWDGCADEKGDVFGKREIDSLDNDELTGMMWGFRDDWGLTRSLSQIRS